MEMSRPTILLFALNFIDAVLTIYWVRNGFATEGNHLMAFFLDMGNAPFLAVKIAVGAAAAAVLWRWGYLRVAKFGLSLALTVYVGLMGVHFVTGLSAFGLISDALLADFARWSHGIFALIQ